MPTERTSTKTWDETTELDPALVHAPRLIRFFRADDPFDALEEFPLHDHVEWLLGRSHGVPSSPRARIWSCNDAIMSTRHARIVRMADGIRIADIGSKNGTFVNGKLVSTATLVDGDVVECGHSFFMYREGGALAVGAGAGFKSASDTVPICYQIRPVWPLATSDVSIHLYGETGTGKEVVARAVHDLSGRTGQFVARNCAAIPDTLFESELFGYAKGAFSGASSSQRGHIAAAHQGTLFLDEIAELSPSMQAKLLRVLELKEVLPLGASIPIPVDFRLVSATLDDIRRAVTAGTFRADLFARLGQTFQVAPLREHKEELGRLIQRFLGARLAQRMREGRSNPRIYFSLAAARALVAHAWPFNVRELKQCIDGALVAAIEDVPEDMARGIELRHLPSSVGSATSHATSHATSTVAPRETLPPGRTLAPPPRDITDAELLAALQASNGNRAAAAKLLEVSERTVFRRLRRLRGEE